VSAPFHGFCCQGLPCIGDVLGVWSGPVESVLCMSLAPGGLSIQLSCSMFT
jgi:hypothetical protein